MKPDIPVACEKCTCFVPKLQEASNNCFAMKFRICSFFVSRRCTGIERRPPRPHVPTRLDAAGRIRSRVAASRSSAYRRGHDRALPLAKPRTPVTLPKLLAVGGAHVDRRGQMSGPFVPGASIPGTDARGCRRRRLQCAAQRRAARHRRFADVGARRRCGRRERRRRHCRRQRSATSPPSSSTARRRATRRCIDRDGEVIAGLADMQLYEIAFAKQLRRSEGARRGRGSRRDPVRRQSAGRGARTAGGDSPTGKQLFAIAISPAKVVRLARRAGQRLLPVHERPRGGEPVGDGTRQPAAANSPSGCGQRAWRAASSLAGNRRGHRLRRRTASSRSCRRRRSRWSTHRRRRCAGRRDGRGDDARQAVRAGTARRHRRRGADHRQRRRPSPAISGARACRGAGPCAGAASGGMRPETQEA